MPATQSNGTVLFRALVMVAFLAVIFYAALSGNVLPDAVRKNIEKYLPRALVSGKPTSSDSANPSSAANAAGEAPLFNSASPNQTAIDRNPAAAIPRENLAAPRQFAPDGSASLIPTPPMSGVPPTAAKAAPSPVMPANYQTPAEAQPSPANPFLHVQDRLKQLGATYYLLETWGNQQQLYRFYCKMAVGGNSNYTRCFEYISADPQQAMAEVLKQVEAWRNGGSQER